MRTVEFAQDSASHPYYEQTCAHRSFSSKAVSFHDEVESGLRRDFFSVYSTQGPNYFSLPQAVISYDDALILDDTEVRKRLWLALCPKEALPAVKAKAVEENYGVLDSFFDVTSANRERLRKKMEDALDE